MRRLLALIIVLIGLSSVAGCDRVTTTELTPKSYGLVGEGGDPLVLMIGVTWTKDGWCSGQFVVHATETATDVRVSNVISEEHSNGNCAGLGTADQTAWASVQLKAPLGDRAVIRASDGVRLPQKTQQ
jgi:hypothetical protein